MAHVRQNLEYHRYVRVRLVQQELGGLDVAQYRAQRLRDFMCDRCSDFAYKREPRSMRNLRILPLGISARARVPAILHQQGDDEDRL